MVATLLVSLVGIGLELACAIAIGVVFRGSPGGVLGPIAFGFAAALRALSAVLPYILIRSHLTLQESAVYYGLLSVAGWLATALLLVALITGRTPARAEAERA